MPQYAALIYDRDEDWTQPEFADDLKEYAVFGEAAATVLRGGAALYPTGTATTLRMPAGRGTDVVASDGPYAETKEVLTGFYLIEATDLDEASAFAAKIPAIWHGGTIEVRPVIDFGG
jgi:hypothetical protein